MSKTIKAEEFHTSKVDGFQDRYIIEYPSDGVRGPLVLYLHTGLADADQGFCNSYVFCANKLRDEVMRRRGVYVAPDYRGDSWMNAAAEADMADLIAELKERFSADKTVLTGTSMGGTSALIFASHRPELVDGVAVLCPGSDMRKLYQEFSGHEDPFFRKVADSMVQAYGGPPELLPNEYAYRSSINHVYNLNMPIVICHGDEDELLNVTHSRRLVEALRSQGKTVHYDEISGGVHMSPAIQTPWQEYLDFALGLVQEIHIKRNLDNSTAS